MTVALSPTHERILASARCLNRPVRQGRCAYGVPNERPRASMSGLSRRQQTPLPLMPLRPDSSSMFAIKGHWAQLVVDSNGGMTEVAILSLDGMALSR